MARDMNSEDNIDQTEMNLIKARMMESKKLVEVSYEVKLFTESKWWETGILLAGRGQAAL